MKATDIAPGLRLARGADIAKMPLAKMTSPAEVTARLLAADEFRRRSRAPHLDPDLYRHRIRQATDVLTTSDPAEAAGLVKAAGVPAPTVTQAGVPAGTPRPFRDGHGAETQPAHPPWTGTHQHLHPAFGAPGNGSGIHIHAHTHRNDNTHDHAHAAASAKSAGPPMTGTLAKAGVPRSVTVPTPALDEVSNSRSLADGLTKLQRAGRLGEAAAELGRVAAAAASLDGASKAVEYRRKAAQMSSPADRSAYLELAEQAERAGAL